MSFKLAEYKEPDFTKKMFTDAPNARDVYKRQIPEYMRDIRGYRMIHGTDATDYDIANWERINEMR